MIQSADITIRREREEEFPVLHNLIREAFEAADMSDGDEQDYVAAKRTDGTYIPDLALVAENPATGELLGHVMLTKTYIEAEGDRYDVLLVAALSVLPGKQNEGIGNDTGHPYWAVQCVELVPASLRGMGSSIYDTRPIINPRKR